MMPGELHRAGRRRARLGLLALVVAGTLTACGLGMLLSAAVGEVSDQREILALLIPGIAAIAIGATGLVTVGRTGGIQVDATTGFGAVVLAWLGAAAMGAVPYLAAGTFESPIDALFESMSGFTTTGATLLGRIEAQPDGILFWRSLTQWLGGVGIVLLVVAVAPLARVGLQKVFYAEVTGVTTDRLTPRIADTAKIIAGVYIALTAAAMVAYGVAGMNVFNAVNHGLTTMATGGFSTRTASIGAFDSAGIEAVAVIFMTLAGINFAIYWRLIRHRSAGTQMAEAVAFVTILGAAIVAIVVSLELAADASTVGRAIRDATFSAVSLMTTTGYTTADFDRWNEFARVALLALMVVGASAGSTAGGVKVIRAVLLGKAGWQELQRQTQPTAVRVLRFGGRNFPEDVRVAVLSFLLVYVLVFGTGTIALAICGLGFDSSLSATAATLNNIGPGLGDVGAVENYQALPAGGRLVTTGLMLAGRLEIFTVFALLAAAVGTLRRR